MKCLLVTGLLVSFLFGATGCLPEELSDSQLANYCKVPADCANYPAFACFKATCSAENQCVKGDFNGPGSPCQTSACTTNCVCSGPANKSVPIGTCAPGK